MSMVGALNHSASRPLTYHSSVEEGVDVEHGLQLQSMIQAVVLVALPTRQIQHDNTESVNVQ